MATSASIELLGIFEDGPQRDFVSTLIEVIGSAEGYRITVEPRLTAGCRFDYLKEHFDLSPSFAGVVVGVDGAGLPRAKKLAALERGCPPPPSCLWAIAEPSVEEWMMADVEALPAALKELFGAKNASNTSRPGRAKAERTAKQRLRDWVESLLGEPVLQGGVEYAKDVARKISPGRIGPTRNGDLRQFLQALPDFLRTIARPR